MAYFPFAHRSARRRQDSVPSKNTIPLFLPVLQAPEISSLYIFEEEKYEYESTIVPDRYSTATSQYLTTTLLPTYNESRYYPMRQSTQFPFQFNRYPQREYPSYMYYHR